MVSIDPATLEAFKIIAKAFLSLGGLIKIGKKEKEIIENHSKEWMQFVNEGNITGSPVFFLNNSNIFLGDLDKIPQQLKQEIYKTLNADNPVPKKEVINFYKLDFHKRIETFQKSKRKTEISKYYPHLSYDLRKILDLSVYVKEQYEVDRKEAHRVKGDIGYQYGIIGRKICNLYSSDYIELLLGYLEVLYEQEELNKRVNNELIHFIEHSDYIFFVNTSTDIKATINILEEGMSQKRKYLAVHSTGNNISKNHTIKEQIEKKVDEKEYKIDTESFKNKRDIPIFNIKISSNEVKSLPKVLLPFECNFV